MKKVPTKKVLVACECNKCGEKANAQLGTEHFYCKGIKLPPGKRLPANLKFPTKGSWVIPAPVETEEVKVA